LREGEQLLLQGRNHCAPRSTVRGYFLLQGRRLRGWRRSSCVPPTTCGAAECRYRRSTESSASLAARRLLRERWDGQESQATCLLLNRHIIAGARFVDVVRPSSSTELTC